MKRLRGLLSPSGGLETGWEGAIITPRPAFLMSRGNMRVRIASIHSEKCAINEWARVAVSGLGKVYALPDKRSQFASWDALTVAMTEKQRRPT